MDRVVRWLVPAVAIALVLSGLTQGAIWLASPGDPASESAIERAAAPFSYVEYEQDPASPDSSDSVDDGVEDAEQSLRTCQLDERLVLPLDGVLSAQVVDLESTEVLWSVEPERAVAPASVVKLVTAVAALRTLGPNYRLGTLVVQGDTPGSVVLVGGGDVTLSRQPGRNYYQSTSSLNALASDTLAALRETGQPGVQVIHTDTTRYQQFPLWDETWRPGSAGLGYVAPVSPLQIDGDRNDPLGRLSGRSMDPGSRAASWFADALVGAGNETYPELGPEVELGQPGRVLASQWSAPLSELVTIMLRDSDNTLAEVIAREVALERGEESIGRALVDSVGWGEGQHGLLRIQDGSGLSDLTRIPSSAIIELLIDISQDEDLDLIRSALPIAAETGSLQRRFVDAGSEVAGRVEAKTGSIQGTRSLAGYLEADDGSTLVFSVNATGPGVSDRTRNNLDALVADFARCGVELADWVPSNDDS